MSTITRRLTLVGGAAVAATAALPSIPALADDAALFAALAEYRRMSAILDAHQEANGRLYENVVAGFPAMERWHNSKHRHTMYEEAEACRECTSLRAAANAVSDDFNAALRAAGWDEDEGAAPHDAKMAAYDRAAAIPVRTLAGLLAKVEMINTEFVWDHDQALDIDYEDWMAVRADIRRLAGEAQS